MKYRADIDGLRAIAVLSVVFFHVEAGLLSGGFVGVDIFFVISGYLITSIILKDILKGEFSYWLFWEKRVRRIFPAALACFSATSVVMLFILGPRDLYNFGNSLLSNGFFSSNIYFWKSIDYFNRDTEAIPLIHTWSLSIEEQFYIFLPMTLGFLNKFFKEKLTGAFCVLLFLSFILCVVGTSIRPTAAFYLLPTRAWEMGAGSLLALYFRKRELPQGNKAQALGVVGLSLLIYSIVFFSKRTLFPGYMALFPVVGTMLIIISQKGFVNKILGLKPFVAIGKVSYSLYLWHWVCLVGLRHLLFLPPSLNQRFMAAFLALVLSVLSYFFVERPFRVNTGFWNRGKIGAVFVTTTALYLFLGAFLVMSKGLPQRFGKDFRDYKTSYPIFSEKEYCAVKEGAICHTSSSNTKEIFLWGDSHAKAVVGVFRDVAQSLGYRLSFAIKNSCPPLWESWVDTLKWQKCEDHNREVYDYLLKKKVHVFVVGRYDIYYRKRELSESFNEEERFLSDAKIGPNSGNGKEKSLKIIENSLKRFKTDGLEFTFLHQVPSFPRNPIELANKKQIYGGDISLTRNVEEVLKRTSPLREIISNLSIEAIDPYPSLCPDRVCSAYDKDKHSLYYDDDHLSVHGAKFLAPVLKTYIMRL